MLIKAFELKHEFPFDMFEGTVMLDIEQLIPTSVNRASAIANKDVHIVKPNLGNEITLFGVTHGQNILKMVVFSSGNATRYYWFSRKGRYTYLAPMGSNDLDEAWLNLFKSFMVDSRPTTMEMYDVLKHFALEYLKTLGDQKFEYDLTGKWKGDFAHIKVAKESFYNRQVDVTVGDKTRMCDFKVHPLVEMIG